jgi:hypothetical protein
MGVPTSEVVYPSATTGRGDHEVHKGHVVALEKKMKKEKKHSTIMAPGGVCFERYCRM